jgi:hypothetical protein
MRTDREFSEIRETLLKEFCSLLDALELIQIRREAVLITSRDLKARASATGSHPARLR